jgi:hypothetical protein
MSSRGWLGRDDQEWLRIAGRKGWLAFTADKKMLTVPHERQTIIDHRVGLIFLTNGEEHSDQVLRLLLNKWKWIQQVNELPRPFAKFLSLAGRTSDQYKHYRL